MSFELVSKEWAEQQLRQRRINFSEIDTVYFDIDHGRCGGHGEDDYCYCYDDTGAYATIHYKTTNAYSGRSYEYIHGLDFPSLLKQLVEWGDK